MRCATAGKLVTERRGRPGARLHPALEADLARHLSDCPACAADAALEARLAEDMACAAAVPGRPIDVRARVLIALAAERPVDRRAATPRQIVVGALLAGAAVAALACAAAWLGPALVDRVADTGVPALLGGWLARGLRAGRALGVAGFESLRGLALALLEALDAIPGVRIARAYAFAALGHLALASMLILSAWWIGRDVLRPARRAAREETQR